MSVSAENININNLVRKSYILPFQSVIGVDTQRGCSLIPSSHQLGLNPLPLEVDNKLMDNLLGISVWVVELLCPLSLPQWFQNNKRLRVQSPGSQLFKVQKNCLVEFRVSRLEQC